MDEQEKQIRNTLMGILAQVEEMPKEEQEEFWNTLDDALPPEWVPIIRNLNSERQMIKGIADVFQDIPTENGDPITEIGFVGEDGTDSYKIDLKNVKYK